MAWGCSTLSAFLLHAECPSCFTLNALLLTEARVPASHLRWPRDGKGVQLDELERDPRKMCRDPRKTSEAQGKRRAHAHARRHYFSEAGTVHEDGISFASKLALGTNSPVIELPNDFNSTGDLGSRAAGTLLVPTPHVFLFVSRLAGLWRLWAVCWLGVCPHAMWQVSLDWLLPLLNHDE